MNPRPRYTRKDNNHSDIVNDLRKLGMVVVDVADLGGGRGDLIVSWRGVTVHVEVKDEGKRDGLTEGERKLKRDLERVGCRLVIAEKAEDVVNAIEELKGVR